MKNGIAIVAGFFLMVGSLGLLFGTIIFILGGAHPLLVPAIRLCAVIVIITATIGLFDRRVFSNSGTWLGVW